MKKYRFDKIQRQGKIIRAHITPPDDEEPVTLIWNLRDGEAPEDRAKQINQAIDRELVELNASLEKVEEPVEDVTDRVMRAVPQK
jgi:hypothetical protein